MVVLYSLNGVCYAQSHNLPQPQASTDPVPPPPVGLPLPLDDYIPLLLVAGLAYGVYKLHKTVRT